MRTLLTLALLTSCSYAAYPSLFWSAEHVAISASVPFAINDCLRAMHVSKPISLWSGIGITAGACATKELVLDSKPSRTDIILDIIGLTFAAVVIYRINR